MRNSRVRALTESALMVAAAFLLARITVFEMPFGGSITLCCGLPILLVSYRHGLKWGVLSGAVLGLLELLMGLKNVMYCATLLSQIGCILLDYLLAFASLGLASLFHRGKKNLSFGAYLGGGLFAGLLRYLCSFLSGALLWGSYASETLGNMGGVGSFVLGHFTGTGLVVVYSLVYNACYMIPEGVLTAVAFAIVARAVLPRLPEAAPSGR